MAAVRQEKVEAEVQEVEQVAVACRVMGYRGEERGVVTMAKP